MRVDELFREDGRGWDEAKVRYVFLAFEVHSVLDIPISQQYSIDEWCWDFEKDGVYSVKTGYRAIIGENAERDEASSSRGNGWIWSQIWKVPIIPRVKMFFWQLCSTTLPTKERLRRTGIEDGVCPLCGVEAETDYHMIWECPGGANDMGHGGY